MKTIFDYEISTDELKQLFHYDEKLGLIYFKDPSGHSVEPCVLNNYETDATDEDKLRNVAQLFEHREDHERALLVWHQLNRIIEDRRCDGTSQNEKIIALFVDHEKDREALCEVLKAIYYQGFATRMDVSQFTSCGVPVTQPILENLSIDSNELWKAVEDKKVTSEVFDQALKKLEVMFKQNC